MSEKIDINFTSFRPFPLPYLTEEPLLLEHYFHIQF